jgi:hypothetical protein
MPATPARYGFISREFRHAVSQSPSTKERHGNLARESEVPIETFFDNVADAQIVADRRQALLSAERRRFRCQTMGIEEMVALDFGATIPVCRYVDADRQFNAKALVCEIYLDLDKQQAALAVWG